MATGSSPSTDADRCSAPRRPRPPWSSSKSISPLSRWREQIGADAAGDAWRRSRLAVFNLRARIAELGLRCDLRERPDALSCGKPSDRRCPARRGRGPPRRRSPCHLPHRRRTPEGLRHRARGRDPQPRQSRPRSAKACRGSFRGRPSPRRALLRPRRSDRVLPQRNGGRGAHFGGPGHLGEPRRARHRVRARLDRAGARPQGDLHLGNGHSAAAPRSSGHTKPSSGRRPTPTSMSGRRATGG